MKINKILLGICCAMVLLCTKVTWALPGLSSASGTHDRIHVSLYTNDENIKGDSESYCRVHIYGAAEAGFDAGEKLSVTVKYNGITGFTANEEITADEETNGVSRTFECDGDFGDFNTFNISAQVDLEDWGWLEVAESVALSVTTDGVIDDSSESNNSFSDATELTGTLEEYISRNEDYFEMEIAPPADVILTLSSYFAEGPIHVEVFEEGSTTPFRSHDLSTNGWEEGVLDLGNLTQSRYYVLVQPLLSGNYNFYEIKYAATSTGTCVEDEEESLPCEKCGSKSRVCNSDNQWGYFEDCENQGLCNPGETQETDCTNGIGTQEELCSLSCEWLVTVECPPASIFDGGYLEDGGLDDGGMTYTADSGLSTVDSGSTTETPPVTPTDAGNTAPEESPTDAGNTATTDDNGQPPGEISVNSGGCACQENDYPDDGRIPALLLLGIWWWAARRPPRKRAGYFGRNFQGRWVSRHD